LFGFDELLDSLPIKDVEAEVGVGWIVGGANGGAFEDPPCVGGEDAIGKGVSNVFGKANEVPMIFAGVGGEGGVIDAEIDGFVPGEAEDDADVDGGASKNLEGNAMVEGRRSHVIENEANIVQSEQPGVLGGSRTVEDGVGDTFDILPSSLSKVLVLHVRLALPVTDM
jgi:hypothetical protein